MRPLIADLIEHLAEQSYIPASTDFGKLQLAEEVIRLMSWAREQGAVEGHQAATYCDLTLPPLDWNLKDRVPFKYSDKWRGAP